jgi:hypothetical protein
VKVGFRFRVKVVFRFKVQARSIIFRIHKHDYKHIVYSVHYICLFFWVSPLLFIVLLLVIDVHHVVFPLCG